RGHVRWKYLLRGRGDLVDRLAERDARLHVERDRDRWQLSDVVDRLWADSVLEPNDRLERHHVARWRLDRDLLQRVGLLLVLRIELEQHAILRALPVERCRPAWAESVAHRVGDRRGRQSDCRGLVTIDLQIDTGASRLEVGRDV